MLSFLSFIYQISPPHYLLESDTIVKLDTNFFNNGGRKNCSRVIDILKHKKHNIELRRYMQFNLIFENKKTIITYL